METIKHVTNNFCASSKEQSATVQSSLDTVQSTLTTMQSVSDNGNATAQKHVECIMHLVSKLVQGNHQHIDDGDLDDESELKPAARKKQKS